VDEQFLRVLQRELADGYGVYALTATEAHLVRLPRGIHHSTARAFFGTSALVNLLDTTVSDRYGRVWVDETGRVNVEHGTKQY
jgi:hypothetical protein